jgi:outer membrane protein assembly factor BamD (BamD/ComL family)
MKTCRKIEGLIAASCYEPPSPEEQQRIEEHTGVCDRCRREREMTRAFVASVPAEPILFEGDLRPALRAELERRSAASAWTRWFIPAAATLAVLLMAAWFAYPGAAPAKPGDTRASAPARQIMRDADSLIDERNYTGALIALGDYLKEHPGGEKAGEMLARMADIEFTALQRYPEACAAYEQLKSEYPETFMASAECIRRLDLLTEARKDRFEPLYAFDRASESPSDRFREFEKIAARYPGSLVADQAVNAMARIALDAAGNLPDDRVAVLETVRERCNEPLAAAQVNIVLGETWWKERNNLEKAREFYTSAAATDNNRIAKRARDALSLLNAHSLP